MAHFMNANGAKISKSIQHVRLGHQLRIGVYGAAGLSVGPNDRSFASIKPLGGSPGDNYWYDLVGLRQGNVMVEAKQGSSAWDFIQLAVDPAGPPAPPQPKANGKYTDNPNEVPTVATQTTAAGLRTLCKTWPALTAEGCNSIIAHHFLETSGGKSCFNWNLGNEHENTGKLPHMFLRPTLEAPSPSVAAADVREGEVTGLARLGTAKEKSMQRPPAGRTLVAYYPPHDKARFRAYGSIVEGGQKLLSKYKGYAARFPDFLPALNRGDLDAIAKILKQAGYYGADEATYARGLKTWRARI